jgi:hypothetical protein
MIRSQAKNQRILSRPSSKPRGSRALLTSSTAGQCSRDVEYSHCAVSRIQFGRSSAQDASNTYVCRRNFASCSYLSAILIYAASFGWRLYFVNFVGVNSCSRSSIVGLTEAGLCCGNIKNKY